MVVVQGSDAQGSQSVAKADHPGQARRVGGQHRSLRLLPHPRPPDLSGEGSSYSSLLLVQRHV